MFDRGPIVRRYTARSDPSSAVEKNVFFVTGGGFPGIETCYHQPCMNSIIRDLVTLQQILRSGVTASSAAKAQAAQLEQTIPPALLAHFLRQLACDRRGVAVVQNGVCGACHIRVSSGTVDSLNRGDDVLLCESCGCYLAPAPEEGEAVEKSPLVPTPVVRRRGRRKSTAAVL
jgi:hypothetical protein